MAKDSKFNQDDMVRFDHADLIDPVIQEWIGQRTVAEVVDVLKAARVPCSVVNTIDKLEQDSQVAARDMIVNIDYPGLGSLPVPGPPMKLSLTPLQIYGRAPQIGEHNKEIYCDILGFSEEELKTLKRENII